MKKFEINWRIVFWVSITILFLWLLAKALGFIHTPFIIETILYATGFATIIAIIKEIEKYAQKLETVIIDIKDIKFDIKDVKNEIKEVRNDIHNLDKRVAVLETKIVA